MVQYSEGFLRRKRQALVYVPRERLHGERIKKDTEYSENNV